MTVYRDYRWRRFCGLGAEKFIYKIGQYKSIREENVNAKLNKNKKRAGKGDAWGGVQQGCPFSNAAQHA